jgi:hypothetical protein
MLCEICGTVFDFTDKHETMCYKCEWLSSTPLERAVIFTKETNTMMYHLTQS